MIPKTSVQEDDILSIAAEFLRSNDFNILSIGANQASRFTFNTKSLKRKAPDLVAFRKSILLVCEAKVRAAALLKANIAGESDYECLTHLMESLNEQAKLIIEAKGLLKNLGLSYSEDTRICVGLIAATRFNLGTGLFNNPEIILIRIDPISRTTVVVRDNNKVILNDL